jgi:hypothetical protein
LDRPSVLYHTCLLAFSLAVFNAFIQHPGINSYEKAKFGDMLYGRAHKPFVSRALVPLAVRSISALTPESLRKASVEYVNNQSFLSGRFKAWRWETEYAVEYAIASAIIFASLLGFGLSMRRLTTIFFPHKHYPEVLSLSSIAGLLLFSSYPLYVYDFTALFLFTLALSYMYEERWTSLLIVYSLTCLNKETGIVVPLLFALTYKERIRESGKYRALLCSYILIFTVIRSVLTIVYWDNPGSVIKNRVYPNILFLRLYPALMTSPLADSMILMLYVSALWGYKVKPALLRESVWIPAILLALMFLFGNLGEWRNLYEAYPILLLNLAYNISRLRPTHVQV